MPSPTSYPRPQAPSRAVFQHLPFSVRKRKEMLAGAMRKLNEYLDSKSVAALLQNHAGAFQNLRSVRTKTLLCHGKGKNWNPGLFSSS